MKDRPSPRLRDAYEELHAIRLHLARGERLRSLRARSVSFAAIAAALAGTVQSLCIPDPAAASSAWLSVWLGTAAICALAAALEVHRRPRSRDAQWPAPPWQTWVQFAPSLFVGVVITWLVTARLPERIWLLPGLWQLLFALGCFAAWRILPRATWLVGATFVVSGTTCLLLRDAALQPLAMAAPFTFGLALLAVILSMQTMR